MAERPTDRYSYRASRPELDLRGLEGAEYAKGLAQDLGGQSTASSRQPSSRFAVDGSGWVTMDTPLRIGLAHSK